MRLYLRKSILILKTSRHTLQFIHSLMRRQYVLINGNQLIQSKDEQNCFVYFIVRRGHRRKEVQLRSN